MNHTMTFAVLLTLVMAVAVLFAAVVGVAAGVLARMSGVDTPAAVLRGGAAFGCTLALALAILTLIFSALG